jgi:transposase InsO family protein
VPPADPGSNYTSDEFGRFLTGLDIGRTGVCYDNAMAEMFFSALNEWLHHFVFTSRAQGTTAGHPLHRRVLQPPAPALRARLRRPPMTMRG